MRRCFSVETGRFLCVMDVMREASSLAPFVFALVAMPADARVGPAYVPVRCLVVLAIEPVRPPALKNAAPARCTSRGREGTGKSRYLGRHANNSTLATTGSACLPFPPTTRARRILPALPVCLSAPVFLLLYIVIRAHHTPPMTTVPASATHSQQNNVMLRIAS